ncbi:pentapeptide repeat-containing protein [Nostoc sp. FACHB-190]|uniref:pentapeptide repeat-containing protein n=1 Tax=Nostoc sp. FACHB-190 TaxID=2692838 RepID=UPI0016856CC7|nr:pentapeptide repeat-containing protein [Nostoc sp. FACHB-190]MBD2300523.1 pentapeptide repeat-containing protein [Nostoc sp. FACHB-190]
MNKIKHDKKIVLPTIGIILILTVIVIVIPQWAVNNTNLTKEKRLEIANSYRTLMIQGFGALSFLITATFTWQNLKVAEANLKVVQDKQIADAKVAEANLKATQDKQLTERFAKAVEMLGHQDIHVRLGAIYLLERISKDSEQDYWQIMEVLTAYVREKSPYQYSWNTVHQLKDEPYVPLPTDIQAVLTVIGRRKDPETKETISLDLSGSNLRGAKLGSANLKNINFRRTNLSNAYLKGADLEGAILYEAVLLERANLVKANLSNANLGCVKIAHGVLRGANLTKADLGNADLSYSLLNEVDLKDAELVAANLLEAHLYSAKNLDPNQIIKKAINWEKAHYDPEFYQQIKSAINTTSTNNL